MHLESLNIFCDVVRHQSFSRGAMASSVSQSAASQAVRQIEKRLG
ncbi:MAG: LysR family transcriptional regulator, partial [Acidobacteria bacterium]|nr:LysR family transcriptional regulator [Acidobacteriota bacterium]